MNGLGTSCDAEVSKPPANTGKKPGGLAWWVGERDEAPARS